MVVTSAPRVLKRARIASLATYVPPRVLTNADLERMVDTSDEWIMQRVGIRERHIVDPGVATSDLAREASLEAIKRAGLTPDDIDYINPHGTGTPENDKMEAMGVATVFGERAKSIPMSSNKSMIGHTLSAAGAVEAVFSLLTLRSGRIPPTINYQVPDPAIPMDVVPNVARDAKMRHAISNSFGFGGQNVSLVMGLPA